ncbi:PBP1A family penicillin-binding protein [Alkalihalobacillus macyae]|uniref:PBP1A family penicillin-binding protein n=1 Tax=Guptibacillus hwajinpoensis TaxID=208199 RepID=UPI00273BAB9B|nr:PBP1A family penicillin-binding protein [Alkalihalobacillus macyae]MDP4549761.1 PBP1A family penicillin-binding protein [Alkalihalobacillus macyae]
MSDYQSRQERRKSNSKKKPPSKKRGKSGLFKKILLTLVILFLVGIAAGGITAIAYINNAPELDPDKLANPQSSVILDRNDEEVQTLAGTDAREIAKFEEIPDVVKQAFVSVEDTRFYEHFGIDPKRIGGAVLANITQGFGAEGASTITQQVIKNSLLTSEKSLERKVQEAYLSVKLEQEYSKDQILEMYLNKIYFGNGAWGVVAAADTYFGKNLIEEELTAGEAAMLAGLPQRPSYYDPFENPDAATKRKNIVLSLMEKEGVITAEEADKFQAEKVEDMIVSKTEDTESDQYKVFMDQVVKELRERDDITEKDIYSGGLKIYTTLDTRAQDITTEVVANYPYSNEDMRSGLVLLDTKTGSIRAIGETRKDENVITYATTGGFQPGSTAKPIIAYGPAIENMQWSTGRSLKDEPLKIGEANIRNWDRNYRGQVSMRRALEMSYNVPAVNTFLDVGEKPAQEFANKLGMNLEDDQMVPTAAIGTFSTSPLQMSGAYAAFGNGGTYNEPHSVRKVVFPNGQEINLEPESAKAMNDYTAYMISDMLKSVVDSGTGTDAKIPGLPVAGKTGTTNHDAAVIQEQGFPTSGIVKDAWFAGYTTEYSMAVWTGYNKPNAHYLDSSKGEDDTSKLLFKEIMSRVSEGINTADFQKPDSVIEVGVEKSTGLLPSDYTPKDKIVYELFVKGNTPEKTSTKYQQPDGVTGLSGQYNADSNSIALSWKPGEDKKFTYKVEMSVNGGGYQSLTETGDTSFTIENVEKGSEYKFKVTAVTEAGVSTKPSETTVSVPAEPEPEPEEDTEEEQEQEEETPSEEGNEEGDTSGNGDQNGDGNQGEEEPPAEDNGGTPNEDGNNEGQNDGEGNTGAENGNGNDSDAGSGNENGNSGSNTGNDETNSDTQSNAPAADSTAPNNQND